MDGEDVVMGGEEVVVPPAEEVTEEGAAEVAPETGEAETAA